MPTNAELEAKLWKAIKSDRTMMLGIAHGEEGHSQPMTGQLDESRPHSIWFFTSTETDLARRVGAGSRAFAHFASKGHDLFSCIHGDLAVDDDRAIIEKLWNPFVAAWFEGGKEDPTLLLLRLDAEEAQIWENEVSLLAGVRLLLGRDPKKDYQDKVAEVRLS